MLLGDPPRTQFDLNFPLLGIPVRVHPLFWLVALLLGMSLTGAVTVLIWIAAVFVGVLVHELGHALAMRAYGFYPWITLYGLGGLTSYDQQSFSRSAGSGALGQVLICLAGPAAGFLLAALLLLGVYTAGYEIDLRMIVAGLPIPQVDLPNYRLEQLVSMLLFVCIAWGAINLLPVYPLDGGQIAREIMAQINRHEGIRQSLQLSIVVAVAVAIFGLFQWKELFLALLFGYLAFSNYVALKAYSWRGPW
ncbi:MAG: site-2 protease family protein [Pirellulales bacterium]|nr:site-2 protease family protein [Pirellulales bacterium]